MRISKALLLGLVAVKAAACAPHVTIADASAGGESGEGGSLVTAGAGGVAGMSSTGGSTPFGGVSSGGFGGDNGVGGTAGGIGQPTGCEQPIDTSTFGCDAGSFLRTHCARGGCHNAVTRAANLDLTLDSLLAARLLDVPATLTVYQPTFGACVPRTCPPRGSTMLLNTASPADSWMLRKMDAFDVEAPSEIVDMGCGTAMPYPPGNTGFTSEQRVCLQAFFLRIIETAVPCALPRDPLPEQPICPRVD